METSHFIYMRKCNQLIGFRGTSNSRMAFCGEGQMEGSWEGRRSEISPGSVESVFVTICVTGGQ